MAYYLGNFLQNYDLRWHEQTAWFKFLVMLAEKIFLKILVCPEEIVRIILELLDRPEILSTGIRDLPPTTKTLDLYSSVTQYLRLQHLQCPTKSGYDHFNQIVNGLKSGLRIDIWTYLESYERKHQRSRVFEINENLFHRMLNEGWDHFYESIAWLSSRQNFHKI